MIFSVWERGDFMDKLPPKFKLFAAKFASFIEKADNRKKKDKPAAK